MNKIQPGLKTFDGKKFDAGELVRKKNGLKITLVIPAKNEAKTIVPIVKIARRQLCEKHRLLDEIIVIDGDSTDGTGRLAALEGAKVYRDSETLTQIGLASGKGNALFKSLFLASGDIIIFIDGDISNFRPLFVTGLAGPLICDSKIKFVKAFYRRPLVSNGNITNNEGGRVTELLARPLINAFFPEIASIRQPLSGEYAIRRSDVRKIAFASGYGVEMTFLLETLRLWGKKSIAQSNLDTRIHRNQSLRALGKMSYEVLQSFLYCAKKHGRIDAKRISRNYIDISSDRERRIPQAFYPPAEKISGGGEIIFVRHGRTKWNSEKRIQSVTDIPLDQTGIKQAKKAASKLKTEKVTAVYSSPLKRSRRTADIIASNYGLERREDERLVEISHGKWAGQKESLLRKKFPAEYSKWRKKPWLYIPPGAESWESLFKRTRSFLKDIKARHRGEKVIVVGHKGSIAAALACMKNKGVEGVKNYLPLLTNGSIRKVNTD